MAWELDGERYKLEPGTSEIVEMSSAMFPSPGMWDCEMVREEGSSGEGRQVESGGLQTVNER